MCDIQYIGSIICGERDSFIHEPKGTLFYRHAAVLVETIKKGIHDADAEARVEARK